MKVIIYFLLLQAVIFSEAKKLREITYYEYYPVITEKIETGMEIQIIKGYCVIFENKCSNFLYVPKYKIGGGLDINAIKKININLLNYLIKSKDVKEFNIDIYNSGQTLIKLDI